jgi:hypothetical protein
LRRNYLPSGLVEVKQVVSLSDGGTSTADPTQALINLNLVPRTRAGVALGLIPLNANNKIDPQYLQNLPETVTELDGPPALEVEAVGTYTITNFDSRFTYNVEAEHGEVSVTGNEITYTAPIHHNVAGGFTVNEVLYQVTLIPVERIPDTPSIETPANDLTQNSSSMLFIASAWSSQYPEDSLAGYHWQISTTPDFSNLVVDLVKNGLNADRHTLTNAAIGQSYYTRVALIGFYGYTSEWSDVRTFTRPPEQKPATPSFISPAMDGQTTTNSVELISSAFAGTAPGDTHESSDFQASTSPDFSNLVVDSQGSTVNKTTREFVFPQLDTDYYFRVRYTGTSGWVSDWSPTRSVRKIVATGPETPSISSPSASVVEYTSGNATQQVTFQASVFQGTVNGDQHLSSTWRFSTTSDMATLLPESGVSLVDLTSITVALPVGETLYVDVAYTGTSGATSEYSSVKTLLIDGPAKPSILSPTNNATGIAVPAVVTASAIQMASGQPQGTYHARWELATDINFTNVIAIEQGWGSNPNSETFESLAYGLTVYLRVRYTTVLNMVSPWSDTVRFTTVNSEIAYQIIKTALTLTAGGSQGESEIYTSGALALESDLSMYVGRRMIRYKTASLSLSFGGEGLVLYHPHDTINDTWDALGDVVGSIDSSYFTAPVAPFATGDMGILEVTQLHRIESQNKMVVVAQMTYIWDPEGTPTYHTQQGVFVYSLTDPTAETFSVAVTRGLGAVGNQPISLEERLVYTGTDALANAGDYRFASGNGTFVHLQAGNVVNFAAAASVDEAWVEALQARNPTAGAYYDILATVQRLGFGSDTVGKWLRNYNTAGFRLGYVTEKDSVDVIASLLVSPDVNSVSFVGNADLSKIFIRRLTNEGTFAESAAFRLYGM